MESQKLSEIRKYVRDITLSVIMEESYNITIDKVEDRFSFGIFRGKRKKAFKQLNNLDAILTGSAALSLYRINGELIFERRKPKDFDFIVIHENLLRFCGMNNLTNVKYGDKVVSINLILGIDRGYSSYGGHNGWLFKTGIDLISKDKDVNFIEVGEYKIENLFDIIRFKLKLIDSSDLNPLKSTYFLTSDQRDKHINDLYSILTKILAYG